MGSAPIASVTSPVAIALRVHEVIRHVPINNIESVMSNSPQKKLNGPKNRVVRWAALAKHRAGAKPMEANLSETRKAFINEPGGGNVLHGETERLEYGRCAGPRRRLRAREQFSGFGVDRRARENDVARF